MLVDELGVRMLMGKQGSQMCHQTCVICGKWVSFRDHLSAPVNNDVSLWTHIKDVQWLTALGAADPGPRVAPGDLRKPTCCEVFVIYFYGFLTCLSRRIFRRSTSGMEKVHKGPGKPKQTHTSQHTLATFEMHCYIVVGWLGASVSSRKSCALEPGKYVSLHTQTDKYQTCTSSHCRKMRQKYTVYGTCTSVW